MSDKAKDRLEEIREAWITAWDQNDDARLDFEEDHFQSDEVSPDTRWLVAEVDRLRADNARLRAALEQYLDKSHWMGHWCYSAKPDRIYHVWAGEGSGPDLARKALAGDT